MAHGKLPFKPQKSKKDKLDELVNNMISYIAITTGAATYLGQKKLLSPKLDYKLMTEVHFCKSLLKNMIGVTESYIKQAFTQCMNNPKYQEEVEKLAEMFVPNSTKLFRLYTDTDFSNTIREEDAKKKTLKNIGTGGGLIIR